MATPTLTAQLDRLEANLPTINARILRLQRTMAGASFDRIAAIFSALFDTTKNFLETARISGKTVTGQARAAGADVVETSRDGAKTVAGQARAAAGDVASSARTGARTVTGQAGAQGRKVAKTAKSETTKLIDKAIDAVEDDIETVEDAVDSKPGSGRPYEQWTKADLLERAQELDVEGRSGLNKKQLIAALRSA